MATGDFLLQHNAKVTVIHRESGESFGPFRTRAGGGKTGENTLVRPGGMAPPVATAGTYGYDEATVGKAIQFEVDSGLVQKFYGWHGERFDIIAQPLDSKGRSGFHKPDGASGLLNGSTPPEHDADGNDPQTLELTFTIDATT
jgi:hypothetical protein